MTAEHDWVVEAIDEYVEIVILRCSECRKIEWRNLEHTPHHEDGNQPCTKKGRP